MTSLPELDLDRNLLNSGYPVILPPSYTAFLQLQDFDPTTGPMVVGYKVQKLSVSKVTLWIRFTSPSGYVDKTIQMYPKRLEPKNVVPILAFCVLSLLVTLRPPHSTILA
jgi:hypothetical protein